MLKVRPQHLTALAAQQAASFCRRMVIHLRDVFPEEVKALNDAQLRAFVQRICAQADQWSIQQEQHIERLIELFVCFDTLRQRTRPDWIDEIVTYPSRPGEQILCMLEDVLLFGDKG